MRKKLLAITAAVALGTATTTTGALAFGARGGGHAGGFAGHAGGFGGRGFAGAGHWGGGWNHGGFARRGYGWGAAGLGLGLGLGGLYAYGSYPYAYGYCDPNHPDYYNNGYCGSYYYGW